MNHSFHKMHGLGNDFIIIDARKGTFIDVVSDNARMHLLRALSDRKRGIGCDQLALIRTGKQADVRIEFYNADGSSAQACGNATRCIGWLMMGELAQDKVSIESVAGILHACKDNDNIMVNMGLPNTQWDMIPLASEVNTLSVPPIIDGLPHAIATNIGNPHVTYFMDADVDSYPLHEWGPVIERNTQFPEGVNVSLAYIRNTSQIQLRTWERGVGLTDACGTAACAAMVAARRSGLCAPHVDIILPGGVLTIGWDGDAQHDDAPVMMSGSATYLYHGTVNSAWVREVLA